jgi:hypothetical protein
MSATQTTPQIAWRFGLGKAAGVLELLASLTLGVMVVMGADASKTIPGVLNMLVLLLAVVFATLAIVPPVRDNSPSGHTDATELYALLAFIVLMGSLYAINVAELPLWFPF